MPVWLYWAWAACVAVPCAGYIWEKLQEGRDRKRYLPPGELVDVGGGRRMHLFSQGNAAGPTVVIEQGAGSPSVVWWPVQAAIAKFARVCTYDRPGYLWSDPVAAGRDIDDRVADLFTLLSRAGTPSPYIFVAHSMGGLIARRFARAHPELVAGMVLVDAPDETVMFRDSMAAYYRQGAAFQKILRIAATFGLVRALGRSLPMLMLPDDAAGYALCSIPQHAAAVADDMNALLSAPEPIRQPPVAGSLGGRPLVLLTHGVPFPPFAAVMEEGWLDGQHRLAGLSTDSELIVAEKSSHLIFLDEPELIVDSVRRVHAAVCNGMRLTTRNVESSTAAGYRGLEAVV